MKKKIQLMILNLAVITFHIHGMTVVQPKKPSEIFINNELGKIYDNQLKKITTKDAFLSTVNNDLRTQFSNLRYTLTSTYGPSEPDIKVYADYEYDPKRPSLYMMVAEDAKMYVPPKPASLEEIDRIINYLFYAVPQLLKENDGRGVSLFYEYYKNRDNTIFSNTYTLLNHFHNNLVMPYAQKNMLPVMSPSFKA